MSRTIRQTIVRRLAYGCGVSLLAALAALCAVSLALVAPEPACALEPAKSNNQWDNGYNYGEGMGGISASPTKSYLRVTADGSLERIEWIASNRYNPEASHLIVERYDDAYAIVSQTTIDLRFFAPSTLTDPEQVLWGGYFAGAEANYVVTGQSNPNESNQVPVVRVTKFSLDWQMLDYVEYRGINTVDPFSWGAMRAVEQNGRLYLATCHTMYASQGVNHQASMYFVIDEATMEPVETHTEVAYNPFGYASHSLNQFITTLDSTIYTLNQSDGYPWRGVLVSKHREPAAKTSLILPFAGTTSEGYYQQTGASVGGFESSSTAKTLIAVGASVDQDAWGGSASIDGFPQKPWVAIADSTGAVRTTLSLTTQGSAHTPILVKCEEGRFAVLWGEDAPDDVLANWDGVHVQLIDGEGNLIGKETFTQNAVLSDCHPVIKDGKAIWYATAGSPWRFVAPTFYEMDLATGSIRICTNAPDFTKLSQAIAQAKACEQGSKSDDAWRQLQTALSQAESVANDPASSQKDIDAAASALDRARDAFLASPDVSRPLPAPDFIDMVPEGSWSYDYIVKANGYGLMTGYEGLFKPFDGIKRAEAITVLYRTVTGATDKDPYVDPDVPFTDLDEGALFYGAALEWAYENGIIKGDDDPLTGKPTATFRPDDTVSRQELAIIIWRVAGEPAARDESSYWATADHGSEWITATAALKWTCEHDILSGVPDDVTGVKSLLPENDVVREQAAKIFVEAFEQELL